MSRIKAKTTVIPAKPKAQVGGTHYSSLAIEPIQFIETNELGYHEGNVVKYISRAGKKDNETRLDDLLKAQAYIHKLVTTELNNDNTSTGPDGSSDPVQEDHGSADGYVHPWYTQDPVKPNS